MKLIATGEFNRDIKLKWNECLFVDKKNEYYLYTECGSNSFDYMVKTFLEDKQRTNKYFTSNAIKLIKNGKYER